MVNSDRSTQQKTGKTRREVRIKGSPFVRIVRLRLDVWVGRVQREKTRGTYFRDEAAGERGELRQRRDLSRFRTRSWRFLIPTLRAEVFARHDARADTV